MRRRARTPHEAALRALNRPVRGVPGAQMALRAGEYLFAALFGVLILERCNQGGISALWLWVSQRHGLAVASVFVLLCIYTFLRVFFRKPFIPFVIYGVLVNLAGAAHLFKMFYRGEPLFPNDIFNIGPAFAIAGRMQIHVNRGLLINLLCFLLSALVIRLVSRRFYQPLPIHPIGKIVPGLLIPVLCLLYFTNIAHLEVFGVLDIRYDQYNNYLRNGFVLSTVMNLADSRVDKPEGYGREAVADLRRSIEAVPDPTPLGSPPAKPHIIVLQMEAYADPRAFDPAIRYAEDPFDPLYTLDRTWPLNRPERITLQHFHTLVSIIGGGTSDTEFEFLTGYSMRFCPMGVTPFIRYMDKAKPSLATDLSALGYRTVAMHPHKGSFYNRDEAYPRLGFDRFVTQEEFVDPQYIGYVSDESFGDKVIELFEEEKENGPMFLFGISIQNHGPYNIPELQRDYPLAADVAPTLDAEQIDELETFGANLYDSSTMLARLLRYFSQIDEPVLLLVFGDHQAAWPWIFSMKEEPQLELKKYSTESFFWANYPLADDIQPVVSAAALAPLLMRKAGLPLPLYQKGLWLQSDEMMAYNISITVENDGSVRYIDRARVEGFRMLQYDRVFGGNYIENDGQETGR